MEGRKQATGKGLGGIWLAVLLLCILVLASAALLGSFIRRYITQEKNVISVMADANAIREQYNDKDLPVGAVPGFENTDGQAAWETATSVDLFKNTYTDADGRVTVQSGNGDRIIAPGTSNDYTFTLKNTGNISLDYTLNLSGAFSVSGHDLPFYVRLRCGEEWITGSETAWVHVDELGDVIRSSTLPRGASVSFLFEWQWPYDADEESDRLIGELNDSLLSASEQDTVIGNIAVALSADFRLNIATTVVVTPGAIPSFDDGTGVAAELVFVIAMTGLLLSSGIWLLLLLLRRKVYLTGIITPAHSGAVMLGHAKAEAAGGRFIFPSACFGKRALQIGDAEIRLQLKSGKAEPPLCMTQEEGRTVITLGRQIRALELFVAQGDALTVDTEKWAAIDKKHNVHTPAGITPPTEKKNATPNGLCVDEDGKFSIGPAAGSAN